MKNWKLRLKLGQINASETTNVQTAELYHVSKLGKICTGMDTPPTITLKLRLMDGTMKSKISTVLTLLHFSHRPESSSVITLKWAGHKLTKWDVESYFTRTTKQI